MKHTAHKFIAEGGQPTNKIQKREAIVLYTIFAFFCAVLWLVLIDRGFIAYLITQNSFLDPRQLPRLYNLVPFQLFREQSSKFGLTGIVDANVLGNIIMFIPVGIFTCIFTKNKNPYKYIFIVPLLSAAIEVTQFVLATGSLDVDDFILNSTGGFIGVGIFAVIYKLSHKDVLTAKRFITIVASLLPPYLLIFFYKLFMDIDEVRLRWYDVIVAVVYYLLVFFLFNDCSRKWKKFLFQTLKRNSNQMEIIARIKTDMPDKFGIPRQSGIVEELAGKIIFEPEYRVKEALLGIEEFSHLWLIWEFSENKRESWSPTVRPPRLGGEVRKGVFATRSPFRPNPIGMSCVKLEKVEYTREYGPVIYVSGVDLMNNTPIYDIKPYITYTDSRPDAVQGFAENFKDYALEVHFPKEMLDRIPEDKQAGIIGILKHDPRPAYQNTPDRVYGVRYLDFDIHFKVNENKLTVIEILKEQT